VSERRRTRARARAGTQVRAQVRAIRTLVSELAPLARATRVRNCACEEAEREIDY